MKAFNLARVDKEYDMAMQAWLNHQVTATKTEGAGKSQKQVPIYKKFEDFFDYKKRLEEIEKPIRKLNSKEKRMAKAAAILNAKGG